VAECGIAGTAEQWASDACLWQYETDNLKNSKVQKCIKRAEQHIQLLGECDAKHLFKNVICAKTSKWNMNESCLTSSEPLGPSTSTIH
jgi:hypothetical protein